MKILIVEDEEAMAAGLKFNFEQEGYEVLLAGDGPSGLKLFQEAKPPVDLVMLDLMLPGMSGYETCTAIRSLDKLVPVLVLSAKTLTEDKMHAFDCGTDQFMTKPFELRELLNRVRNLMERHQTVRQAAHPAQHGTAAPDDVTFGNVRVNFQTFEVTVGERTHNLTTQQMKLLKYFLDNPGRVLSRHEIMEHVWDDSADVTTRTIDNFVMQLRKIIEPDPSRPRQILSVRGTGYRFLTGHEPVKGE
ncbi:MAG: response regulator transcription factor [Planctomycetaceae bacterium]|nr:response regulator transcription factor [Planctomycetaceae bacterium]